MEKIINPWVLLLLALFFIFCWCHPPILMSEENLTAKQLFLLGKIRANDGNLKKIISYFNKVLEINPQYFAAYLARGCVWLKKNDYDRAISDLNKALEVDSVIVKKIA